MITVDTTFVIHLWRDRDRERSGARELLSRHSGEDFTVPAHAAGEFLEGGASVSDDRMRESMQFLRLFRIGEVTIETASHYARIVAQLRFDDMLQGRSKADLWIAAWAVENASPLATTNIKHFGGIPGLTLLSY